MAVNQELVERVADRLMAGYTVDRSDDERWSWSNPRHGFHTMTVNYVTYGERLALEALFFAQRNELLRMMGGLQVARGEVPGCPSVVKPAQEKHEEF
jgi:hypothetical protein